MFKKIISALLVLALCLPIGAMTASAETVQPTVPAETGSDAYIMEDGTAMTMELAEIETAETGDVYVYEIEYDGVLDHTIQVDLENDRAVITYADGTVETLVVSEHVRVTKIKEAGVPSFSSVTAELLEPTPITSIVSPALPASTTNTNYVYTAEPFEIDASGNQLPIGNTVYGSGYELVGTASFVDPIETGYLIRKPMGFDEFDDYYYEVDFGTAVSVAISVISTAWSIVTGDVIGLVLSLASLVWTIGDNIVKEDASGYFACREYSWHYRVRANSPYNTTLREATKYRYWWVAYNEKNGEIGFIERNDIADGWLLSNFDLIAAGLGRLPL